MVGKLALEFDGLFDVCSISKLIADARNLLVEREILSKEFLTADEMGLIHWVYCKRSNNVTLAIARN